MQCKPTAFELVSWSKANLEQKSPVFIYTRYQNISMYPVVAKYIYVVVNFFLR